GTASLPGWVRSRSSTEPNYSGANSSLAQLVRGRGDPSLHLHLEEPPPSQKVGDIGSSRGADPTPPTVGWPGGVGARLLYRCQFTNKAELRFRALLTEGG